jgi:DNA-binding CsgD family transcriptional regulator
MKLAQEIIFKTSEAAYAVNREGQIVAWNRAAENVFGYPSTETIGKKCWELMCGRDSFDNEYCCEGCPVRSSAFANKSVNGFHIKFRTASLEMRDFTVSALLLRSAAGNDIMVHLCRNKPSNENKPLNGSAKSQAPSQNPRGNLTQRECEILILLAEGSSTEEMSSTLCISKHTVRNHIQHILFKLQVSSRLKAINLSRRLGVI